MASYFSRQKWLPLKSTHHTSRQESTTLVHQKLSYFPRKWMKEKLHILKSKRVTASGDEIRMGILWPIRYNKRLFLNTVDSLYLV